MKKLKMHTPNLTQENIARIREVFPGCVTEARDNNGKLKLAVDFDQLRQELSDSIVEGPQERYQLNWPGKREALLTANTPITKTLRPCRKESVDFDTTRNLFIEGDNLDALKLLQETYLGKIKVIYIDPPYNTGNSLIYKDDFTEHTETFLARSRQKDKEGNRLVANAQAHGRLHSDWLSMMYPRLKLARNLLHEEGVIYISIDDAEQENLKKLCAEIFGDRNFVCQFVWIKKKKGSHLSKTSRNMTEYALCYAKNILHIELFGEHAYADKQQPLAKKTNCHKILRFKSGIVKTTLKDGRYLAGIYGNKNSALNFRTEIVVKNGTVTSLIEVEGPFVWTQEKLENEIRLGTVVNLSSKFGFNVLRAGQHEKIKRPSSILDAKVGVGTNEDAYQEAIELFGSEGVMSYPKPSSLVQYLINTATYFDKTALVVDFFAGSATTAQAVMQLNAQDGGNRKFIMVQLAEPCDETSEAFKAGYKTIAEIGKERIRRAGNKILEGECHEGWNKDVGFRVLKVDSSNMADVYFTPDTTEQTLLDKMTTNIKPDRSSEDLLLQVLLDWGVDLCLPIRRDVVSTQHTEYTAENLYTASAVKRSFEVFFVNENALVACFDSGVNEALIKELARFKPTRVVLCDTGFVSDTVKINAKQIFKQISPGTEVKSI